MPTTLTDACIMLADAGAHGRVIAGGTDLMVHWPQQMQRFGECTFVDLSRVDSLRHITWDDQALTIGALTTYWDIIQSDQIARAFPLLVEAAKVVGSVQIQTRGTWAGNIMNASPAADGVLALMVYGTSVVLTSATGSRTVALDAFYTGYRTTVAQPGEVVEAIVVRRHEYDIQHFEKVGTRQAQAITKVGLALTLESFDREWRVVMNSVAPTVCRCRTVEGMLRDRQAVAEPCGWLAAIDADISPIDDIRSTGRYRRLVAARMLHYTLAGRCEWVG